VEGLDGAEGVAGSARPLLALLERDAIGEPPPPSAACHVRHQARSARLANTAPPADKKHHLTARCVCLSVRRPARVPSAVALHSREDDRHAQLPPLLPALRARDEATRCIPG
jgi:hypothetical protein